MIRHPSERLRSETRTPRQAMAGVVMALGPLIAVAACGAESDAETTGDGEVLRYWSMWQESEPDAQYLQEAIDAFEAETGITVEVEWHGRDVMNKVLAAQNTDSVPDIVTQSTSKVGAVMVNTDQYTDLSSVYEMNVFGEDVTIGDVIDEDYSVVTTDDDTPFLVPMFVHAYALWYDAARLTDVAANPPQTWSEFSDVLADAHDSGQSPLALDADIGGYASVWPGMALSRALGPGGLLDLVTDPTGAGWDAPEVREAMTEIGELAARGYFPDGYDSSKWPAIQRQWFDGEADFLLMGSWVPLEADTKDWAPEGFELAAMNFPAFGDDTSVPFEAYGFAIPKKAENVEAAKEFIAFMLNADTLSEWSNAFQYSPHAPTLNWPARSTASTTSCRTTPSHRCTTVCVSTTRTTTPRCSNRLPGSSCWASCPGTSSSTGSRNNRSTTGSSTSDSCRRGPLAIDHVGPRRR